MCKEQKEDSSRRDGQTDRGFTVAERQKHWENDRKKRTEKRITDLVYLVCETEE